MKCLHFSWVYCILLVSQFTFAKAPTVLSSFPILNDLVKRIAPKDSLTTQSLIPLSSDPHSYKMTAQDMLKLQQADLILVWGLGFDKNIENLATRAQLQKKLRIVTLGQKDLAGKDLNSLATKTAVDPHIWQSLKRTQDVVRNISKLLESEFPQFKKEIGKNTDLFILEMQNLESKYKKELADIAIDSRKIMTSHDAFKYLGEDIGVEIYPLHGIDPEQTPSLKHVHKAIRQIRERQVKAIFTESGQNSDLLNRISKESGVPIAGHLHSDRLSPQMGIQSYMDLMDWNLKTIAKALKDLQK